MMGGVWSVGGAEPTNVGRFDGVGVFVVLDWFKFGFHSSSIKVWDRDIDSIIREKMIEYIWPNKWGFFGRIRENWNFFFLDGGTSRGWDLEKDASMG